MKVGDGVSVGVMDGISLGARVVTGISVVALGVSVKGNVVAPVMGIMSGVGETTPGVREGMAVHAGIGCGLTFHVMQAVNENANARKLIVLFMSISFVGLIVSCPCVTRKLSWK